MKNVKLVPIFPLAVFILFTIKSNSHAKGESLWAETKDGRKIHIMFFKGEEKKKRNFPVILCHGLGAQGRYWYFDDELSWPKKLNDEGFNVFVPDLRGVGKTGGPYDFSFEDYIYDVEAILEKVLKVEGVDKAHWVGHSMGGMVIYLSVSRNPQIQKKLKSFTAISSPYTIWAPWELWRITHKNYENLSQFFKKVDSIPFSTFSYSFSIFGDIIYPILKITKLIYLENFVWNLDNVPRDIRKRAMRYATGPVSTRVLEKFSKVLLGYEDFNFSFEKFKVPALFIVGTKDYLASPPTVKLAYSKASSENKKFILAGVGEGFQTDYGHVDITASKLATEEIFSQVLNFIKENDSNKIRKIQSTPSEKIYKSDYEESNEPKSESSEEEQIKKEEGAIKENEINFKKFYSRKSKYSFILVQDFGIDGKVWETFEDNLKSKKISYMYPEKILSYKDVLKSVEEFCISFTSDLNIGVFHGFSGVVAMNLTRGCFDAVFLISTPFSDISSFYRLYIQTGGKISEKILEKIFGEKSKELVSKFESPVDKLMILPETWFPISNRIFYIISTGDRSVYWWNIAEFVKFSEQFGVKYSYTIFSYVNLQDELSHIEIINGDKASKYTIKYILDQIASLKK
ncbi:MAG: alpha/beta hydrolase [Candidatus Calescibacterium sp.]|jgi:pimeloyl-ACP methyl ester carboxylesterase|nr:alpha/beta hydrolase [Candidatus Calescibacterium sp.]